MSHEFLDPKKDEQSSENQQQPTQQKVDPVAQMKWLENLAHPERNANQGILLNQYTPAQRFAMEEEEKQARAKDEEELQMKSEEEELQQKPNPTGSSSGNTQMPADVKQKMEGSFGTDFSGVNIHKDSGQANDIGALAYTQGSDIHFAPGQYNPGSQKGQELLGHELTHVVQQREGRVKPDTEQPASAKATADNINTDPTLEKEADELGKQAAQGKMADVKGKGNGLQRQEGNKGYTPNKDTSPQDITISEGDWFGGLFYDEEKAEDMILHGTKKRKTYTSGEHNEMYLTGSKEGWSKILEYMDDSKKRETFLAGFLKAATIKGWAEERGMKSPAEQEIIDFLKALYSEDINTELNFSSEKTPDKYVGYGFDRHYNPDASYISQGETNQLLAKLIVKYQHKLVDNISSNRSLINTTGGVEKLAHEGTTTEEAYNKNPIIVKAMITNAFANALVHAKYIISDSLNENGDSFINSFNSSSAVRNYGEIIRGAVQGFEDKLTDLEKGAQYLFDVLWSTITIPIPSEANPVLEFAKIAIKEKISGAEAFKNKNITYAKIREAFNQIIGTVGDEISQKYKNINSNELTQNCNILIEAFEVSSRI